MSRSGIWRFRILAQYMPMQPLAEHPDAAQGQGAFKTTDTATPPKVPERGGPAGPEPTRFGDWERRGRCIDF
jgi:hypothetical protein